MPMPMPTRRRNSSDSDLGLQELVDTQRRDMSRLPSFPLRRRKPNEMRATENRSAQESLRLLPHRVFTTLAGLSRPEDVISPEDSNAVICDLLTAFAAVHLECDYYPRVRIESMFGPGRWLADPDEPFPETALASRRTMRCAGSMERPDAAGSYSARYEYAVDWA
ncbi:uncharacterized protein BP5553_04551 [Venustampulla echinocandica]|uniref:Uncharacterized protein n=1 Tax=Venustampulla echinocandica TaxID=2656787 RepID=A0A370TNM3_9HELO|nr:uncharacterized protein BP5553_04551 [Venustampulla echinocandica]RDL37118.1 hypothetical protein BP5553_04551 [Venustampulla echinocandica]